MSHLRSRTGFTLVELLVVSAVFLLFFSLVVTAARPNAASQVRQLSQDIVSALLATQTRAMTSESGAGLILDPSGAILYAAQSQPYISGTVSGLSLLSTGSLSGSFWPLTSGPLGDDVSAIKLLAGGTSGRSVTPWLSFSAPGSVGLDTSLNQTAVNTILPTWTTGFLAARIPIPDRVILSAPRYAAIDLRYSGVGMVPGSAFGRLSTSGTVALVFDRAGCLDTLTQTSGFPRTMSTPAPLYLLIATTVDIANNTSLQSRTSRWIAIAPDTGRISVSANVSGTVAGVPTAADINSARWNAQQDITQGAR